MAPRDRKRVIQRSAVARLRKPTALLDTAKESLTNTYSSFLDRSWKLLFPPIALIPLNDFILPSLIRAVTVRPLFQAIGVPLRVQSCLIGFDLLCSRLLNLISLPSPGLAW